MRRGVLGFWACHFLLLGALIGGASQATPVQQPDSLGTITLSGLPEQGRETYRRIHEGGPWPYEKDGVIFNNREHLLPIRKRGYYREYTVKTPRVRTRGIRRIVCGGLATAPDVCYYTADHYASYRRIVP